MFDSVLEDSLFGRKLKMNPSDFQLLSQAKSGNIDAKTTLFQKYEPCVYAAYNNLSKRINIYHMKDDFISEGRFFLWKEITLYDISRGVKFTTFLINRLYYRLSNFARDQRKKLTIRNNIILEKIPAVTSDNYYRHLVEEDLSEENVFKLANNNIRVNNNKSIMPTLKPSKEELTELRKNHSKAEIGRMYNVHTTAVWKWCKKYGIE